MNTQRFQELKSLLTQGKDFGRVLTFFFDHIGEAPELPAVSQRVQRPIVETAVQAAVQQMTGQIGLTEFLLLSVDRLCGCRVRPDPYGSISNPGLPSWESAN